MAHKGSWYPWEDLPEEDREHYRRVGEVVARAVLKVVMDFCDWDVYGIGTRITMKIHEAIPVYERTPHTDGA